MVMATVGRQGDGEGIHGLMKEMVKVSLSELSQDVKWVKFTTMELFGP